VCVVRARFCVCKNENCFSKRKHKKNKKQKVYNIKSNINSVVMFPQEIFQDLTRELNGFQIILNQSFDNGGQEIILEIETIIKRLMKLSSKISHITYKQAQLVLSIVKNIVNSLKINCSYHEKNTCSREYVFFKDSQFLVSELFNVIVRRVVMDTL
jgi:predicted transcriptional regulator